tara:strand:+ start:478 stop:675 length:198 start_codon:yes stop_codon:yes gene_type:complete
MAQIIKLNKEKPKCELCKKQMTSESHIYFSNNKKEEIVDIVTICDWCNDSIIQTQLDKGEEYDRF